MCNLYAFLFIVFLVAQDADTSITIAHFQYPATEGIPIILDETGESTYFLDKRNPRFMKDVYINGVQLDGSLGIPLGSYFLPKLLPIYILDDSIHNHSQIYYRKGDYDYSDLGISLQIESSDSGLFNFQGFKRSPPQLSQTASNELQNYLLSYQTMTEKSYLSVDVLYHIEDYNLPINYMYANRTVESFHGGISIESNLNQLSISVQPAFQFTYLNQLGMQGTYLTIWNEVKSQYYFGDNFNVSLRQNYKMRMAEYNSQVNELPVHVWTSSLGYDGSNISFQGGIAISDSTLNPVGTLVFKWSNSYLSVNRNYHGIFLPSGNHHLDTVLYLTDGLSIGYSHKLFYGSFELFHSKDSRGSKLGLIGEANIKLPWLNLQQHTGLYNLDDNRIIHAVDIYSLTKLIFSPNVWIWRDARYQPFIGFESIFMKHSGKLSIDPISWAVFSNDSYEPYASHLMNLEVGFLISGFKVSYRWINCNLAKIKNSVNSDPIPPIRHLEVVWQFLN